jgi:alkanesulfonate monooxygenase SsuD/methylene tetrahydromethanopterin reductase-like flavin-dependent oxidoreductase (luciferase family)
MESRSGGAAARATPQSAHFNNNQGGNMRLGFFMMPVHPPARSFTEILAEDTEKSLLADRLGFTELWLGEHFSATSEPIPSPMMFMAALLPRTKNLSFGTGVVCIPNHDPVVVAAEAAQFDHMSGGRFMLGIGPGGLLSDFELFRQTDVAVRNRKVVEAARIMRQIWSQDPPYDIAGEFWNVRLQQSVVPELGIGYMPKPFQKGGPPISISLASPHSSSARTAALNDCGILSANITPTYSVASHWAIYSKTRAEAGKRASGEDWRVARNIMVAPTDAEAYDRVFGEQASNHYLFDYVRTVLDGVGQLSIMKPRPDMADKDATVEAIIDGCTLYGSPKTMLDKLVAFREEVGPFGTLLMTGVDWLGPNEAWERQSMQLMAEEVMPQFRQHVLAQAAE